MVKSTVLLRCAIAGCLLPGCAPAPRLEPARQSQAPTTVRPPATSLPASGDRRSPSAAKSPAAPGETGADDLPVRPGQRLDSLSQLGSPYEEGPSEGWTEDPWPLVLLENGKLERFLLRRGSNAVGVAFLAPLDAGHRVVGTFGARDLSAEMNAFLRGDWLTPDRRTVVSLIYVTRRMHGFTEVHGGIRARIAPRIGGSWIALGADVGAVWNAAPELHAMQYTRVLLEAQGSSVRLLGCWEDEQHGYAHEYEPGTRTFGPPRRAELACPIRPSDYQRPEWRLPYTCYDGE